MYKVHVKRTIIVAVIGIFVAFTVAFFSKKIYEGRLEMLLGANLEQRRASVVFDDEVSEILDRNKAQGLLTERQLLNSETVFRQALNVVDPTQLDDWEDLYLMYDVVTARTANQNQQGAGVAQIRVRAYSEDDAKEIANEIAVAYNSERTKAANAAVDDAIRYVQAQISATETNLDAAEQAVQTFMSEKGIAVLERKAWNDTDFRGSLIQTREAAVAELNGLDNRVDELTALIAKTPDEVPDWSSEVRNPQIDTLERNIIALETQKASQLSQYTADNPKVKQTEDALASAKALLLVVQGYGDVLGSKTTRKNPERSRLETELSLAYTERAEVQGRLNSINQSLDDQDAVLSGIPEIEIGLGQLQRDRAIFDEKYRRLKTQLEELQNRRETGPKASVPLGEGAVASEDPVAPDFVKFIFIGFIAGACIGLVMSFSLESLRPRVYTSTQLADLTGLPVVASVPTLQGVSRSRALESLSQSGAGAMESFRNMAYSYLATRTEGSQSVMFTGIGASGSSSISAAQFAVAVAHAGKRVVLVDAERTRQVISNGFGVSEKKGVSDVIQQGADATGMLSDTEHENLKLLPIGSVPEALMSEAGIEKVQQVVSSLCTQADVVVIAVAPSDVVADAAAFAAIVDEICLSVSARTNDYSAVPMAFDILEKAGAKSIKLILTDTGRDGEPFASSTAIQRAG